MAQYPKDWTVEPLSELGEVLMCKRVLKSQTAPMGDIPFYKIGTFGKKADAFIPRDLFVRFRKTYSYPKKGDVLVSAAGTIGRTVVFDGSESYFQDSNIVWLGNDERKVLNSYLYWWYQVVEWTTENGGIVTRLYNGNFRATLIAYPEDISEQRRIVEALDSIDNLIDNLARRIEKKRMVKQGVMQDLLTGEKRLPEFNGNWKEFSLRELGSFSKGCGISRSESNTGNIPAVRYGELYTHHNAYVKTYLSHISEEVARRATPTKRGDILFASSGETEEDIGKSAAILDNGVYAGGDLIVFSPYETTEPIFWGLLLDMPYIRKQKKLCAQGATVVHISLDSIASLRVRIPPSPEQHAIAAILSDMDAEIANLEAKREKHERIKQGMMHDLLTGKVRI